ncbi:helix-turn-helix transcriptional regulator [Pseudonocardia sp. WMMC193]|uniref:helix-turn-helix domain-containing protein n=1 Tax=Pseudonocardia sp. WMMC193 TaxID=2911965 RepID=UPI001F324C47|nr:helix-turn-helix transcriptional regulator [Pseudonocardia sp. WMMC193]MCF7547414.1 helix-turn-helix domain-containing protein [Pseudonocardia sp. WMMC193]MCF7553894.1 helix-turn-helix domain-containing protein [Pseudonocardia sp. WMMC193]MCF7553923.1 helix-turn-helix domain-containing protein [Pseudonocardia sp. WMMC193]MCF7553951.1 helix-turn-helix domain-containing protein [Pseudonocardia sp. WMMC193]
MTSRNQASQLRQLREQRGWTQQDVAEQIARLAWLRRRKQVGVNGDMVAKWERGVKTPSRPYRELLALLFGVRASELDSPVEVVPQPTSGESDHLADLTVMADLFGQLGPAGIVLQPKLFEVWKEELMRRRVLLKLATLAPAAGIALPASSGGLRATPDLVAGFDDLATRYQTLYHSAAPNVLMAPVVAHLGTIRDTLTASATPGLRRKLLANRARVATLAGRIAFFDLHDPMRARGFYNLALESAREAGDHLQAASALGHTAFIPAAELSYRAALDYLRGAATHIAQQPHGPVSSWLAAVESEMHTNAGAEGAAMAAIDRARAAMSAPGLSAELPWFDFYDSTRLDGFAGYVQLRAGRSTDSLRTLEGALGRLPPEAVKQRAVFLCDLATAHLHNGDLDQACRTAADAADHLHRAGYATGSDRLREFRAAVQPWNASPAVRALDDQLTMIA